MLETSYLLLIKYFIFYVFLPLIYGVPFVWIILKNKVRGVLFYLLSWFSGNLVIPFLVFDLNFIFENIYPYNFVASFILLFSIFILSLIVNKIKIKHLLSTLVISSSNLKSAFLKLNVIEKILTIFFFVFSIIFLLTGFIFEANLPSFGDDTFGNWNKPSVNMYYDNKIVMFGEKKEILGRGRLGYPIYTPLYKTIVAKLVGTWNDIYINLFNYLLFFFFILFLWDIAVRYTKSIFYASMSGFLVMSLPLVFYHTVSGYMDLYSAIISVTSIYLIFCFFQKNDLDYLLLAIFFLIGLAYIKNDGFVIYVPGIVFSMIFLLLLKGNIKNFIGKVFKNKKFIVNLLVFVCFFFLPFLLLKMYYNLGFNQAAGIKTGIGLEKPHWEIFEVFPIIFLDEGNYNIILIWVLFIFFLATFLFKRKANSLIFIFSPLFIFFLFNLAFLLTANYKWVLNQTTVNRVFTMVFVISLSFLVFLIYDYKKNN